MAVAHAALHERGRKRAELGDRLGVEQLAAAPDRPTDLVGKVILAGVVDPAIDVAADPGRVELAQAGDRLRGPGAEERVVAAEQVAIGAGELRLLEHRVERRRLPWMS